MVDAHQVTLKSSCGSGAVWFLIYSAHTSSVTFPLLATQYPLPHKCWPQQRLRNTPNSLSNLWELRPFRYCTALDTDKLGGIDRSILHVVSIYRSGMNDHLVSTRRLTKQFPISIPDVTTENRKTIFRRPDHVILTVPDRVATALVPFHPPSLRCKMPLSQAA